MKKSGKKTWVFGLGEPRVCDSAEFSRYWYPLNYDELAQPWQPILFAQNIDPFNCPNPASSNGCSLLLSALNVHCESTRKPLNT